MQYCLTVDCDGLTVSATPVFFKFCMKAIQYVGLTWKFCFFHFQITFHVRELKRIVGGVNTVVGNNEGSLVVGMRMPNLFGRGEKLHTEYSYGAKKTSSFTVSFTKPLRGSLSPMCVTNGTHYYVLVHSFHWCSVQAVEG